MPVFSSFTPGSRRTGLRRAALRMAALPLIALPLIAVLMAAPGARAAVLSFDDLSAPTAPLTSFDYGGLTFSTMAGCGTVEGAGAACMFVWDGSSPNSNGTNNLIFGDVGQGQTVTITHTGGGLFDLVGLEMSQSWFTSLPSATVTINGTTYSLGQGITTLTTNLFGVTSVTLSGLGTGGNGYWLADNIDLGGPAPVPLPAGLPLMLAGLGVLGLRARFGKAGRKQG